MEGLTIVVVLAVFLAFGFIGLHGTGKAAKKRWNKSKRSRSKRNTRKKLKVVNGGRR
jgi:uncharacterized protein HemY